MSEDRLDRAIDGAVREMMRADPRPGLRARVLARLAAPPPRGAWWPRLSFAALAVATVIVVAALLRTDVAQPPAPAPQTVARTSPSEPPPPAVTTPSPATAAPENRAASGVRREALPAPPRIDPVFGGTPGRVSAASLPGSPAGEGGASLPAVVPGPPPLVIREIAVEPLVVEPIRIAPLFPPR